MILCEEHTPHYWYDDSEFEYCPKCQINDLWSKVDELEAERTERADTNASLLAKNIRQQETYTRLYAAYKSSEQDLTALITELRNMPRFMRMQQPHKFGRFVYYDDMTALLDKEGNSDE